MSDGGDFDGEVPDRRPAPEGALMRTLEIVNKKGMHARAAAKFVHTVEQFDAQVRVIGKSETVDGASILDLLMLAAGPGSSITIEASGKEAAAALDALEKLVSGGFGEND
jgi:phosphocarrier protein